MISSMLCRVEVIKVQLDELWYGWDLDQISLLHEGNHRGADIQQNHRTVSAMSVLYDGYNTQAKI